jgi:hypothetical protein
MASITSSNASAPFNSRLLTDANYIKTVSAGMTSGATVYTTAVDFNTATPYPTTEKVIVQLYNTALTGTSASLVTYMGLQDSADNSSFTDIGCFTSSLLKATDVAGAVAAQIPATAQVLLPPNVRQYVRGKVVVPTGAAAAGGITGSFGVSVLM